MTGANNLSEIQGCIDGGVTTVNDLKEAITDLTGGDIAKAAQEAQQAF